MTKGQQDDSMPHWVKTVDSTLTHPSNTEDWNRSFASTAKNNSANSLQHRKKGRKNSNASDKSSTVANPSGKSMNAMLYRGHYSDTSSVTSRETSSSARRDRKRSRTLGLFCILLILAFLLAAFLGWLMYYLLTMGSDDRRRPVGADATFQILTEEYSPQLAFNDSFEFQRIAQPVCAEMDSIFASSSLGPVYDSCLVKEIRDVDTVPGCECQFSEEKSLLVTVKLLFNDTQEKDHTKKNIYIIIEEGTTKRPVGSLLYVLLRNFLVDIRLNWLGAFDGIEVKATIRVYNLRYTETLKDKTSRDFQILAKPFCEEVGKILMTGKNLDFAGRYLSCEVQGFSPKPDRITFVVQLMGREWRNVQKRFIYVLMVGARNVSIQFQTVKIIGTLFVSPVNVDFTIRPINITYPTTTTTTTSTTKSTTTSTTTPKPEYLRLLFVYEVYNLTFTDDLLNSQSEMFLRHEQAVCDDLGRWFRAFDSPYTAIYRGCKLAAFSPNPVAVSFYILFETKFNPNLYINVRRHLERKAPRVLSIPGYVLMDVGYLLLILERYQISSSTSSQIPPSTTLSPSSTLSPSFSMSQTTTPSSTTTDIVASSSINPGIEITLPYEFGLADFFYTTDLAFPFSTRFINLQENFCSDLGSYYKQGYLREFYDSCSIDAFTYNPDAEYPDKIFFTLKFITPIYYDIQTPANLTLYEKPPQVPRGGYVTLQVGVLYLILRPFTTDSPETPSTGRSATVPTVTAPTTSPSIIPTPTTSSVSVTPTPTPETTTTTTTPITPTPTISTTPKQTYLILMSFETLNLTFIDELRDRNSPEFRYIEDRFCADIDEIIEDQRQYFPTYMKCKIERFGGDPLRVHFSLQFFDLFGVDRTAVKELVISLIVELAVRKEYQGVIALLVGNLLIAIDSITVAFSTLPTTPSVYDAISYEYTFYVYPDNFTTELLNKNSDKFAETAYRFCTDVGMIMEYSGFRAIRKRYHGCAVNQFGINREVKFQIVLQETDVVRPSTLFNIFAYHGEKISLNGISYLSLGGLYVSVFTEPVYQLIRLDTFTTHPARFTTTTTPKVLTTLIRISLQVLEPNWSIDLESTGSTRYQLLAEPFCQDLSSWISEWNKDYLGCEVVMFKKEPFMILADLTFIGTEASTLESNLKTIIMERADRVPLGNLYALEIGKLLIYDKFLISSNGTDNTDTSSTTSTTTTPSSTGTTEPPDPCLGVPDLSYVPNPTECDSFYQCVQGLPFPIPCVSGYVYVFEGSTCVPKPPGFVCKK